ncbi:cell wall hydrolase [Ancylobacter sp. MQZ15Z-1]|uniref:Cell wall hydrolase n=1 Tax=Ancylobacter mangrovi TaxID=2972472 RepID=A0A9X2T5F7_9HYPH|nr:cell wall hydrolase [Ancylobacter mangrovi]MCS0495384.1 cell wall hydrolase [Ancylobacter mangrovi]
MRIKSRVKNIGIRLALLVAMVVGGSVSIGPQDIRDLLAHQPGVAERVRFSMLSGSLHVLKASTFAWPSHSALLASSAIPEAPHAVPLGFDINRTDKGDRLAMAPIAPVDAAPDEPGPLALAGDMTPAGTGGAGTATTTASTGGTGTGTGTGVGTGSLADAGIGTDPDEAADDDTDAPNVAARATEGVYSVAAGDPTGDPSQLEDGGGPAVTLGPEDGDAADDPNARTAEAEEQLPLYRQSAFIFGYDSVALPPQPFLHSEDPDDDGGTTTAEKSGDPDDDQAIDGPSPAERLGLTGKRLARSVKCLAEAVYFESRGEPLRGQIAVAQVVVNRVFSGYYPADVCRTVYQNAKRKFACQFTFACDNVKDVVTEPELWKQAEQIADDMLNGRVWDEKVGRATHYHARSVHPRWVREMRKLDRIGAHTFYRPRRWSS